MHFNNAKLFVSKGMHRDIVKEIDCDITVGSRVIEPFYYDDDTFPAGWRHSVNGWSPAESNDTQHGPTGTEHNQYHLEVNKHPYKASVRDGPETQEVRLWRDTSLWEEAEERVCIDAPYAPYAVFMAVLRKPENFL